MRGLRSHFPSPITLRRRQHTVGGETGPARIEVVQGQKHPGKKRAASRPTLAQELNLRLSSGAIGRRGGGVGAVEGPRVQDVGPPGVDKSVIIEVLILIRVP
jgi:hypothetical protein